MNEKEDPDSIRSKRRRDHAAIRRQLQHKLYSESKRREKKMGLVDKLFLGASINFAAMSVAHWTSFKSDFFFVYHDTPFYAYQDKIISFSLANYSIFYYAASQMPALRPYALVSAWATFAGLCGINMSKDLKDVMGPKTSSMKFYWFQASKIGVLASVLTAACLLIDDDEKKKTK